MCMYVSLTYTPLWVGLGMTYSVNSQCLAQNERTINICWMNEWVEISSNKKKYEITLGMITDAWESPIKPGQEQNHTADLYSYEQQYMLIISICWVFGLICYTAMAS